MLEQKEIDEAFANWEAINKELGEFIKAIEEEYPELTSANIIKSLKVRPTPLNEADLPVPPNESY